MKPHPDDTIAAISTPPGRGAIGIVRLSGPLSIGIARRIALGAVPEAAGRVQSRTLRRATIVTNGAKIDDALVAVMRKPKSYTGEDMAEFHCHGNPLVLARVVEACMAEGARPALPGEFTRRAFLNGKMDLSQAEAVASVIEASSERALEIAQRQADGELGRRVSELRNGLMDILAGLEARLEFPEEELGEEQDGTIERLEKAGVELRALEAARKEGMRVREGMRVVIVGKPNAGKSSLFNRLLCRDRALVTPQRGTTRDAIEETALLDGMAVTFVDTAGICCDHADEAGKAGVARSVRSVENADMLIFVADGSVPWSEEDRSIAALAKGRKGILVLNKNDLPLALDPGTRPEEIASWEDASASATRGEGIEDIRKYIISEIKAALQLSCAESPIICSIQQADAIKRCGKAIEAATVLARSGGQEELIVQELKAAHEAIGEITGESAGDELLDKIFTKFCIGK